MNMSTVLANAEIPPGSNFLNKIEIHICLLCSLLVYIHEIWQDLENKMTEKWNKKCIIDKHLAINGPSFQRFSYLFFFLKEKWNHPRRTVGSRDIRSCQLLNNNLPAKPSNDYSYIGPNLLNNSLVNLQTSNDYSYFGPNLLNNSLALIQTFNDYSYIGPKLLINGLVFL